MARKDSAGKRVNVSDKEFVETWVQFATGEKSRAELAKSLDMSYGNVIARGKRLSDGAVAAGQPALPKFQRATGRRKKDFAALASLYSKPAETVVVTDETAPVEGEVKTEETVAA